GRVVAHYRGKGTRMKRVPYSRQRGVNTARLPEGRGYLRIRAYDKAGNRAQKFVKLRIDRTPPRIRGPRVQHLIGGFGYFELTDNVSGSRFAKKRIWARQPGRNKHRIQISDR